MTLRRCNVGMSQRWLIKGCTSYDLNVATLRLGPPISFFIFPPRIKISVNTDISVIGFYGNIGNIGNIGKISVDIFTKISVIKIFHILII